MVVRIPAEKIKTTEVLLSFSHFLPSYSPKVNVDKMWGNHSGSLGCSPAYAGWGIGSGTWHECAKWEGKRPGQRDRNAMGISPISTTSREELWFPGGHMWFLEGSQVWWLWPLPLSSLPPPHWRISCQEEDSLGRKTRVWCSGLGVDEGPTVSIYGIASAQEPQRGESLGIHTTHAARKSQHWDVGREQNMAVQAKEDFFFFFSSFTSSLSLLLHLVSSLNLTQVFTD